MLWGCVSDSDQRIAVEIAASIGVEGVEGGGAGADTLGAAGMVPLC